MYLFKIQLFDSHTLHLRYFRPWMAMLRLDFFPLEMPYHAIFIMTGIISFLPPYTQEQKNIWNQISVLHNTLASRLQSRWQLIGGIDKWF